jgi:PPP family 3-phenylpropionic acid transporter
MPPSFRIAAFYALCFGAFGVSLPYWPLWLSARGLGPDEIGLVFAGSMLAKIVATPLAAALSDRIGRRRTVILGLLIASFGANLLYLPAASTGAIIAVAILSALCLTPVMALTDSLALGMARARRFDYGRVRLFGSAGFMLVALATGEAIQGRPIDLLLWLLLGLLALSCIAGLLLPEGETEAGGHGSLAGQLAGTAALLRQPGMGWFLLAAGLIQNSHVGYYAFSTLYWRGAGISESTIGWLWAEGVVAEILLFAAGPFLSARLGARGLLLLGGAGAALRWAVTGLSTDLAVLVPLQLLHALSFGAAHLGAMLYLARQAPAGLSATAQALYGAVPGGIVSGLVYAGTGILYGHLGGGMTFFAMSGLALLGIGAVARVNRAFPT